MNDNLDITKNAAHVAKVLELYKSSWKDISLPDLLSVWSSRYTRIEENRSSLKSTKLQLKQQIIAFKGSAGGELDEGKELITLVKSAFDTVSSVSKFAEQSFQSAYLILKDASDPTILADACHKLLNDIENENIPQSESQSTAAMENQNLILRESQKKVVELETELNLQEKRKIEDSAKIDREMAKKEEEIESLLETLQRMQENDDDNTNTNTNTNISGSGRGNGNDKGEDKVNGKESNLQLQLTLEKSKCNELENKLSLIKEEINNIDTKTSKQIKDIENEKASLLNELQINEKRLIAQKDEINLYQSEINDLKYHLSTVVKSSQIDWCKLVEDVGFHPTSTESESESETALVSITDNKSMVIFLNKKFRQLEKENVECRLREQQAQNALQTEIKNRDIEKERANMQSTLLTNANTNTNDNDNDNVNKSNSFDGSGNAVSSSNHQNKLLMELTKQRNALQEELTRISVLDSMRMNQRSNTRIGATTDSSSYDYDLEHGYDNVRGVNGNDIGIDNDDKLTKAYAQMNIFEQILVSGSKMAIHDFWSRHAVVVYLLLVHVFAFCFVVHDLNPELVSELDYAMQDHQSQIGE